MKLTDKRRLRRIKNYLVGVLVRVSVSLLLTAIILWASIYSFQGLLSEYCFK